MAYTLPKLTYNFDALEPHIDAQTMEIHHDRHHQGYVDKLNAAVEGTDLAERSIEDVLRNFSTIPDNIQTAVRNHGGGHANHSLFWRILTPGGSAEPVGELAEAIQAAFGSFADFKEKFTETAKGQFGSGWGWLVLNADGQLAIISTANQDSPLMEGHTPLLGVDVWEHAYYLKYQNSRPDYLANIWNVINWDQVEENYQAAK